ncbi:MULTISPECIES: GDSL-type esterase/lipase family protein [Paenibacillus]|uniref:GDSL-type esterase/lipase family protein n=1 Tax=Paenibacillus TaxID=44249 RepID=UPI00203E2E09|nr:GDSL-type esterase/lipase family protein [Paenibacillus lactis]MCM3492491.1 GDSL-type esterase/lipase family protein [Paenibacillus lactis]
MDMRTKITLTILMGSIVLALAACGNQSADQAAVQPESQAQGREGAASGSTVKVYQQTFENSVFLGDSITEGLSFHDVLDEKNVLAGAGKTAEFALEDIEELVKRNPKQVFIQLGSDDILWPTDNPLTYAMNNYAKLIGMIRDKLPGVQITLLTVTPVTEEAIKKEPRYNTIPDFNLALENLAGNEQVGFVDLAPIFKDAADMYDSDGIHFKPEFYARMLDLLKEHVK